MKIRIFEVGGAVRDKLLGLKPKDVDYAVEASSWDAMRQHILSMGGTIFLETPQYFTMRAKVPGIGAADFVLCRKDGEYSDGRHPDMVEPGDILTDLARRDFTINAMACDISSGELIDPHGGLNDLTGKRLRFVGDPAKRLTEDKLRAFRALRFEVTKDIFIDSDASEAIRKLDIEDFRNTSTERIREELVRMFAKDSHYSFVMLFKSFPMLGSLVVERGIWFRPTVEQH